jgi:MarR family 2-MHQ and catechol resistance regulon transcriptional repressor
LFYENFERSSAEIALGLLYTCDVLHQIVSRYMAEYGLSKSTLNILAILRHGPAEGMQLHDLGELLLVSRANITGLIDHLEEKGLVKRVVDTHDRRARLAHITKKGEMLLDEFMPIHFRNVNALFQDVAVDDKNTLTRLLKGVRASLTAHADRTLSAEVG